MSNRRGKFITLEGIDGAGKSTHVQPVAEQVRAAGLCVRVTREPGGTQLGEKLRELLLVEPMRPETEALLMFAARQEHVATVIAPALVQGVWVVCDRFSDASFAYQGGGRGLLPERLGVLEQWVHGDLQPDLTLLFDVATAQARARVASHTVVPDRFEQERAPFFEAVRAAYLERARSAPQRIRIVDAAQPLSEVARQVQAAVWQLLQADAAASN